MSVVHVCRGVNRAYVAQVRMAGARRWRTLARSTDYQRSVLAMARVFAGGSYKRGRVLLTADWYDPVVVTEMHR